MRLEFRKVGYLDESDCNFTDLNKDIGIYKAELDEEVVYIGKATEISNGGLRKRLRDYTRDSDSARNFSAGIKMNKQSREIVIHVMLFPRKEESISDINKKEKELIELLKPAWQ